VSVPLDYLVFKINIQKRLFLVTMGVSLIALLIGQQGFSMGFFIGGAIAMALFSLLYNYILSLRSLKEIPQKKRFIIARSFLMYVMMGIALFIGIKKGIPVFLGVAAGMLSLKAIIFIHVFKEQHASK